MTTPFRDPPASSQALADGAELANLLFGLTRLPSRLGVVPLWLHTVGRVGQSLHLGVGLAEAQASHTVVLTGADASGALQVEIRGGPTGQHGPLFGRLSRHLKSLPPATWRKTWGQASSQRTSGETLPLSYFRQLVPGLGQPTGLVRTGFLCNQDCGFCWQDRRWSGYDAAQVQIWIEDLAAAGADKLLISGGEPTLDPALAEHIRLASRLGIRQIGIETNAIQLAKPGKLQPLLDAGLGHALVSLHSPVDIVSDALTRAPGTFVRTIAGLSRLLEAGLPVSINSVLTARGLEQLPNMPAFLHGVAGTRLDQLSWTISMPAEPFEQVQQDDLVHTPPHQLRSILAATTAAAKALGLRMQGSDGPCGPPLCAFGGDPWVVDRQRRAEPVDFRVYPAPCAQCTVRSACLGVRREDVQRWGDDAVAPIPA